MFHKKTWVEGLESKICLFLSSFSGGGSVGDVVVVVVVVVVEKSLVPIPPKGLGAVKVLIVMENVMDLPHKR